MEHFGASRFSIAFNTLHKLPNALSKGAICSVRSTPLALGSVESRQANRRVKSNQNTELGKEKSGQNTLRCLASLFASLPVSTFLQLHNVHSILPL